MRVIKNQSGFVLEQKEVINTLARPDHLGENFTVRCLKSYEILLLEVVEECPYA